MTDISSESISTDSGNEASKASVLPPGSHDRVTPPQLQRTWKNIYVVLGLLLIAAALYAGYYRLLSSMVIGAGIGWGTNCLALRMLFRPEKTYRFGPWWLWPNRLPAGLLVDRQADVARSIGSISREQLLTETVILDYIATLGLPGKISDWLFQKAEIWRELAKPYLQQFAGHLSSRQFRKWLANSVDCQVRRYSSQKLREFVRVDDRRHLAVFLADYASKELSGVNGRAVIGRVLSDFFDGLESGNDSVLFDRMGGMVKDALPSLIARHADAIAGYLSRPEIAKPLRRVLSVEIEKGVRTEIRKRLPVAGLTGIAFETLMETFLGCPLNKTVEDFLETNWSSSLERLAKAIREQNKEISALLYSKIEASGKEMLIGLREKVEFEGTRLIAERVDSFFASDGAADLISAKLDALCALSPDELCPSLVDEVVERFIRGLEDLIDSLFHEDGEYSRLLGMAEQASLTVLAGETGSWFALPEDERRRICDRIALFIDDMMRRSLPAVLETLDLGNMVEQQILRYTPKQVEEIALQTASDEMKYIEFIGLITGAIAAAGLNGVSSYLP